MSSSLYIATIATVVHKYMIHIMHNYYIVDSEGQVKLKVEDKCENENGSFFRSKCNISPTLEFTSAKSPIKKKQKHPHNTANVQHVYR